MRKSDFHYDLPPERIAQHPLARRSESRLLCLTESSAYGNCHFSDLPGLLRAGDVLVFNDTRVVPARLRGAKVTGGRAEVLIERLLEDNRALAQVRVSKPPKPDQTLEFDGGLRARVVRRAGEFYELAFATEKPLLEALEQVGHVPLPPYIDRADSGIDRERYQTVYARVPGAVAAPTAGLHFDAALLERLRGLGVISAFVTLHVGAGTFQPLRGDEVEAQRLHAERIDVSEATCETVNRARAEGRRVIAVGTTVVRTLETAARDGRLHVYNGETDIFIYPGYRFQVVDALITNFHLPQSSLLMLVCAFAGIERVLAAYRYAVEQRYRFYSYGDAMFLTRS